MNVTVKKLREVLTEEVAELLATVGGETDIYDEQVEEFVDHIIDRLRDDEDDIETDEE